LVTAKPSAMLAPTLFHALIYASPFRFTHKKFVALALFVRGKA